MLKKEEEKIKDSLEIKKLLRSNSIDRKTLNSYLSIPLSKKFLVSEDAMEIALKNIND